MYDSIDEPVLVEIQNNAREAGQRLRASLNLIRSQGMMDDNNYRELVTYLAHHFSSLHLKTLRSLMSGVLPWCQRNGQ